ncbi:hypothetical protein D3C86_1375300 [compost metagenome]
MRNGYNFKRLKAAIRSMSRSQEWESAKSEWKLIRISEADTPETCLCGHFRIIELCGGRRLLPRSGHHQRQGIWLPAKHVSQARPDGHPDGDPSFDQPKDPERYRQKRDRRMKAAFPYNRIMFA